MKGSSMPEIPTATTYKATKKEEGELHRDKVKKRKIKVLIWTFSAHLNNSKQEVKSKQALWEKQLNCKSYILLEMAPYSYIQS